MCAQRTFKKNNKIHIIKLENYLGDSTSDAECEECRLMPSVGT